MMQLLQMLPLIVQLINAAEQALPTSGNGPTKLKAVLDGLGAILTTVPALAPQVEQLKTAAAPLISGIVAVFNAVGHFKSA